MLTYERVVAFTQPLQEMMRQAALDPSPGKLLIVVLILAIMPFSIVVPMTVTCLLAGALLPAYLAPPVILAGLLLNTLMSWSLARTVFGRRIEAWVERRGGALGTLRKHAKEGGFKWTFIARFIPAPFISPPMILASAGVPLGTVLAGTAAAMLPWSFVYAWAGRAGREGSLKSLAMAATAIVLLFMLALRLRRRFLPENEVPARGNSKPASRVPKGKAKRKVKR